MCRKIASFFALLMTVGAQEVIGQSPNYGFPDVPAAPVVQNGTDRAVPANNPWVVAGAQIGYKFSGNSDFADGLLASSRIALQTLRFPKQSQRVGLPLIGNISRLSPGIGTDSIGTIADRLTNTAEGINVGLYPYFEAINRPANGPVQVTFYGSTVWKLNAARDRTDSSTVYLNQGRFTMGIGLDLYVAENNPMPITLTVEPVLTVVNPSAFERVTGRRDNRLYSVELTGILPIGQNMGLLAQLGAPDEGNSLFRVGVIYVTTPSKPNTQQNLVPTTESRERGLEINGTAKDAAGQPLSGRKVSAQLYVGATPPIGGDRCTDGTTSGDQVNASQASLADGTFQINFQGVNSAVNCILFAVEDSGGNVRRFARPIALQAAAGSATFEVKPADFELKF